MGNIVTLEEVSRFSMHSVCRLGQAFFTEALSKTNMAEPSIADPRLPEGKDVLLHAVDMDATSNVEKEWQIQQELDPIFERLENAVGR